MLGKKRLLAGALYRTRLLQCFRRRADSTLVVLNYHRLWPGREPGHTAFDSNVFCLCQAAFRDHVKWFKRHCRIISEEDLIDAFQTGSLPRGPSIMITFDDAYRDFYELAYPVLRDLDVPATLFVPSGMIEDRKLGWWDVLAFLVKRTSRTHFLYRGERVDLSGDRNAAVQSFLQKVKLTEAEDMEALLVEMRNLLDVSGPSAEEQDEQLMTWEQIHAVAQDGIRIGSHAHSHRILSGLTSDEQQEELAVSRRTIEANTGAGVRSISYPVGGAMHFNDATIDAAREAGYELGFAFNKGVNRWPDVNRYGIDRVGPDRDPIMTYCLCFLPEVFSNPGIPHEFR